MLKWFAGIGSRQTPTEPILLLKGYTAYLCSNNYGLRSGGAKGADSACETGCKLVNGFKQIFLKEHTTEEALELASKYHPNWDACNDWARALLGRNMFQILGPALNDPVEFVLCWTPDGKDSGGTGTALRCATDYKIPIYNLFNREDKEKFLKAFPGIGTV